MKKKHVSSQLNVAVFLAAKDSENKITGIQILHRKGQKIKFESIVIIRTGTYLYGVV